MARILLTWELGGGYGHVGSLTAIAAALQNRGHRVVAALKEPERGDSLLRAGAQVFAIPASPASTAGSDAEVATYADLLGSVGFADPTALRHRLAAWDELYDEVRPDTVVFDHSPFAMLAAAARHLHGIQHGTGFYIPPGDPTLPVLRPWLLADPQAAASRENWILEVLNLVLKKRAQSPLDRLSQLYALHASWLATYAELDHFGEVRSSNIAIPSQSSALNRYRGITPLSTEGWHPEWPDARGPRVFAYLQADSTSRAIVSMLVRIGYPAIVRIAGLPPEQSGFVSPQVRLIGEPVRLDEVAVQCDVAILNGGHGTLAAVLLAGKPVVISPIQLEQMLVARRVVAAGLGNVLPANNMATLASLLDRCLSPSVRAQAETFALRYRSQGQQQMLEQLVDHLERLAAGHDGPLQR